MQQLAAEHLIVGAGLLGLAVADHLLRRGASQVLVVEESSSPSRRGLGENALAISTGHSAYRELEERALLLLEESESYLETDPLYRRSGSLHFPHPATSPAGMERLGPAAARRRVAWLEMPAEASAGYVARDGSLDALQLLAALHEQVRRRGGRLLFDCEVEELERAPGGEFSFRAGLRAGRASQVYLTAGVSTLRLLERLRIPALHGLSTWHRFYLEGPSDGAFILCLGGPGRGEGILFDSGEDEQCLWIPAAPDRHRREPLVEWRLLEEFRARHARLLPGFSRSRIRAGHAEHLIDLDPEAPGIIRAAGGRLLAAGAFGVHGVLLAISVGERMAELGLEQRGAGTL